MITVDAARVLEVADQLVTMTHMYAAGPSHDPAISAAVQAMCAAFNASIGELAARLGASDPPPAQPPHRQTITVELPNDYTPEDLATAVKRKLEGA